MRQIHLFLKIQFKEQSQNQNPSEKSMYEILHHFKLKNMNRLAFGHLNNIHSLHNKFDNLKFLVKNSLDIFKISETELGETFTPTI